MRSLLGELVWALAIGPTSGLLGMIIAFSCLISACFTPSPPAQIAQAQAAGSDLTTLIAAASEQDAKCPSTGPLRDLWQQRSKQIDAHDYPVGPGDILQITATDLPEINKVSERVNGQGEIALPLLGGMKVGGLNVKDVSQLIAQRAKVYVRDPRVYVFAQHFASRNVSVMGMVALPGTYALDSPAESILSVLGRAGGIKGVGDEPAAQRVVLFPGSPQTRHSADDASPASSDICSDNVTGIPNVLEITSVDAASKPQAVLSDEAAQGPRRCVGGRPLTQLAEAKTREPALIPSEIGASLMPVIIELDKPSMASCLDLPARPGDIILVPAAGQVGVYGWVQKPGQFNVTPGMTVLNAITGAGGAMFTSNVELLRTTRGTRVATPVDLSRVEHGQEPDLAVQGGDVVLVKGSALGAIPYGVYTLFTKFGTGMYLAPGI